MRVKRAKQYRKLMKVYEVSFNFREPYQILLDAKFILDAHRFKMNLGQILENTVSGAIKPMITQCCIRELYNLKPSNPAEEQEKERCIEVAKAAERRRCGHHELEEPLSALECLLSVIDPKDSGTNKHRYVVASQDQTVRKRLREIAGVPLIYINRSVMILEPMGGKSEEMRERDEKGKIRAGLKSRKSAPVSLKRDRDDDDAAALEDTQPASEKSPVKKKRRIRGPKEPNPLSMMRSKKKAVPGDADGERSVISKRTDPKLLLAETAAEKGQRKRKRKRNPKQDIAGEPPES